MRQCDATNKVVIKTKVGNPPRWTPLQVNNTPLRLDQGGCYIIPVEEFQLECPGKGDGCEVVVLTMDHNQQPQTNSLLSQLEGVVIACDDWGTTDDVLVNLTRHDFTIEVKWLESCSDTAPLVRFRRIDRTTNMYRPNVAGAAATQNSNNVYEWVGAIKQNETIEIKCPGSDAGRRCKFTIVWQGRTP